MDVQAQTYPHEVSFVRVKREGVLAGLPLPGLVGFPDRESADLWAADVKEHPEFSEVKVSLRRASVEAP